MMQESNSWVPFFPDQASTFAWQVDALYFYLLAISFVFTLGIAAGIFFFVVKYREKEKYATPKEIHGSIALETLWSIIPFVISMTIFLGGAIVYFNQYRPPEDTMDIYVVGKQWMWKVQHTTGQREINELHVPVGRKIKLTMTTEDVLHDFYIPAFRTKADVVPGRYTTMWFEPTKPGKYHLYCAEYCGLNHSGMGGWVYVLSQAEFDNWLAGNASDQTPVESGRELFENKLGCATCHQGGQGQRGAVLENIYGKEVKFTNGQTLVRDDNYIRNSILNPGAQIVEGYQPIMPTFKGQVTEEQLVHLVAYIKSLSGVEDGGTTNTTGTMGGSITNPEIPNNRPAENQLDNGAGSEDGSISNPKIPNNRPQPPQKQEGSN